MPRVLDLPQNALCYMIGTIYIDMPLKPNILDEVTAEVGCLKALGVSLDPTSNARFDFARSLAALRRGPPTAPQIPL